MPTTVSLLHGGQAGVIVAASTATAGDHSVQVAVITAVSGVAVVIVGPIVNDWLKSRRTTVDHREELIAEQADFIEHLRAELAEAHERLTERDDRRQGRRDRG